MNPAREYRLEVVADFLSHISAVVSGGSIGEVVMVVRRTDARILLMTKEFYPEGAYRLPTGKMRLDEDPDAALHRELLEETGFALEIDEFLGKLHYSFHCGRQRANFISYVYVMQPTDVAPQPIDQAELISDFRYVPPSQLPSVADQLRKLGHPWRDWGRFRAVAHDFAAEALLQQ